MSDFQATIARQKLQLTRGIMILGGTAASSIAIFEDARSAVLFSCIFLSTFLFSFQWFVGRFKLLKSGAFLTIVSSLATLFSVILSSKHPTVTDTFYFFPVVVATAVVLLGKMWGVAFMILIISFDYSLISNLIPNPQSYLKSTPDVFIDRTLSIALIYGIVVYAEHTMLMAISQIQEKDRQLRLKEKLAALGVFAGGVSHEINNPLAVIKGFIGQIKKWMIKENAPIEIQEKVDRLNANVQRITDVTHSLLALGHGSPLRPQRQKNINLREIALDTEEILKSKIDYQNVLIENTMSPKLTGQGSPNHLRIMIRIIMDNSLDALVLESEQGRIRLWTEEENNLVNVKIQDNGPGIPESIIENIFDPFFTTKEIGKGSGVGLALVARLCDSIGWNVSVKSVPGDTTFCISLPRVVVMDSAESGKKVV